MQIPLPRHIYVTTVQNSIIVVIGLCCKTGDATIDVFVEVLLFVGGPGNGRKKRRARSKRKTQPTILLLLQGNTRVGYQPARRGERKRDGGERQASSGLENRAVLISNPRRLQRPSSTFFCVCFCRPHFLPSFHPSFFTYFVHSFFAATGTLGTSRTGPMRASTRSRCRLLSPTPEIRTASLTRTLTPTPTTSGTWPSSWPTSARQGGKGFDMGWRGEREGESQGGKGKLCLHY